MKKIGIMTFHKSINYGAILQALAMQNVMEKLGYEGTILDYNVFSEDDDSKKTSLLSRIINLKNTYNAFKLIRFRNSHPCKEREAKFSQFCSKQFRLTDNEYKNYEELKAIKNHYDFFVCGSDQIWNPDYTKANPAYFLQFADKEKRIAYAPSFGIEDFDHVPDRVKKQMQQYLCEFSALSVREVTAAQMIKNMCGVKAQVVVDPTFLIEKTTWETYERKPKELSDKHYILFYILGYDKRYLGLINILERKYNMSVIVIPMTPIWKKNTKKICAGVDEFLYLVHHADYVVTDSFHGMMFSLIYRKNFTALKREDTEHSLCSRIVDFLEQLGLESNASTIMNCGENGIHPVNYTLVEDRIKKLRLNSFDYLMNAFGREKNGD
ncbi:MAG: polysaccharide pyruvyl transferase family protein [Lachnospiraceae bacterium]|nr:polysaccharide pyruvyl transferase family protein [Lachnospiraceae bacterium]